MATDKASGTVTGSVIKESSELVKLDNIIVVRLLDNDIVGDEIPLLLLDVVLDEEPEDIVWEVFGVTLGLVTDDCLELVVEIDV